MCLANRVSTPRFSLIPLTPAVSPPFPCNSPAVHNAPPFLATLLILPQQHVLPTESSPPPAVSTHYPLQLRAPAHRPPGLHPQSSCRGRPCACPVPPAKPVNDFSQASMNSQPARSHPKIWTASTTLPLLRSKRAITPQMPQPLLGPLHVSQVSVQPQKICPRGGLG